MLYFVIIYHGKNDVTIGLCPITRSALKIKMYVQSKKFWNVILRQLSKILINYCLHNLRNHPYATAAIQCVRYKIVFRVAHQMVIFVVQISAILQLWFNLWNDYGDRKNIITTSASFNAHRRHYKLNTLIFIVPPVALTEAQVVIIYIFRISISSFNSVTSEILDN